MKKYFAAHKFMLIVLLALTAATVAGAAVILTPGVGVIAAPVVARGSFVEPTDVRFKVKDGSMEVINAPDAGDTVVQQILIAPGGQTGWHSHPGPVVVVIKSGTMSFYDGDDPTCSVKTYTAGQAFIDHGQGHVHIARNEGAENLELWATYFDVPPGGGFRIDVPAPGNCPF